MEVCTLILEIRSRLHDEKLEKWSDNEILDCLNLSYVNLARVLRIFLQQREYKVEKELVKDLPYNFLDIKSMQKGKGNSSESVPIVRAFEKEMTNAVSIDDTQVRFSSSGNYTMTYYCFYMIVDKHDNINLPLIANNALLFYAMQLLLQKKPSQNALQEVGFYKGLYDLELQSLQRDVYRSHESRMLTTPYVYV